MLFRLLSPVIIFILSCSYVFADDEQCSAVFTDGLQNNNNSGTIKFKWQAKLKNSPDNVLDSGNSINDNSGGVSCNTTTCSSSGNIATSVNWNDFPNNSNNVTVAFAQTRSISPGNYDDIKLNSSATLNLSAGDYKLSGSLKVGFASSINISGKVRIFVKNKIKFDSSSEINNGGDATNLLLYSKKDIDILFSSTVIAFIYSDKEVKLDSSAVVRGAVSGKKIILESASTVNFVNTTPDFGDFCGSSGGGGPVSPLVDYHFDECAYTGVGFEVIDQTGNFNAQIIGALNSSSNAAINQSLNLSATDTSDWVHVPSGVVNGLDDFTLSVWVNTAESKSQQEIFHALGDDDGDDELEVYLHYDDQVYIKVRDDGETLDSNITLTDGNWHHVVLTRVDKDVCLFVDGAKQYCEDDVEAGILSVLNSQAIVIGQEQDSFGGSFTSAQSFEGKMDEFKLYSSKLSDGDITNIYNNEKLGKNYDGTARAAVNCTKLLVDYRFDECAYTGNNFEVIDQTGSFNATPHGVTDIPAMGNVINGALDLTIRSTSDWVHVPSGTLNNINDFIFSVWINTSVSKSQQEIIHALGDYDWDDELEIHLKNSDEVYIEVRRDSVTLKSDIILTDGNWHHLALTRVDNDVCLFVDGSKQDCGDELEVGVLEIPNSNAIVIGQEQDSFGGSFSSSQSFEGTIDELKIFSGALSDSEITDIYNYESSGKNYDGSARASSSCLNLIAEYRFEETIWDGSPDEILDNTGNGYHANVLRGSILVNPAPATAPAAIAGDPGTCGYASQSSGAIQVTGLPLDTTTIGVKTTMTFWMNWNGTNNVMPIGWYLHDIWIVGGSMGFNTSNSDIYGISSAGLANGWHHVAVEFTNGSVTSNRMYIDGVEQLLTQRSSSPINRLAIVDSELHIGGWSRGGGYYFQGLIDEVRIYQNALSTAQINTIMNETHACAISAPHHFEIIHDGNGLTCEAEAITIKACANADCSTLYTNAVDVQLSVNGNVNKTVTVLSGSTNTTFVYTQANTATLSLDQTYECKNGASNSCDITFANTGFRFYSDNTNTPIPTQLSGKFSNIGFNASALYIQAIKTNPDTGACQAAFIDDVTIEVSATCVDPTACAVGENVVINNLTTNTNIDTLNANAALTYANVDLGFGNNTQNLAEFIFYYPNAGKIQLHARYNIPDENGNPTGNYMLGSSNNFVVRPFGFYIDIPTNPSATNHLGNVFKKAGEDFMSTLKAVQWQAVDDANNDGVPDNGADLSDNVITTNFGAELLSVSASISHSLVLPIGGNLGTLTNNTFSGFLNGVASVSNMNYSEVGIISFNANLVGSSYLGASNGTGNIEGSVANVGRFIPHHFDLSIDKEGSFVSVCDGISVDMPFAYSGQMSIDNPTKGILRYLEKPAILITPKSQQGSHTLNYSGDFNKLLLSGVNRFLIDDGTGNMVLSPVKDVSQLGVDSTNHVRLTANYSNGSLTELLPTQPAVLKFEYNAQDDFVYKHEENSEIIPFSSDINLAIASVIDNDGVSAIDADGNGDTGVASDTVITLNPSGKEIRFGRASLANSFGPETSLISQTLQVQYLSSVNGSVFHYEPTVNDICTAFDSANVSLTTLTLDKNTTGVNVISGQFSSGETQNIKLNASGVGNQGKVGVEYDIYPWLEYYWSWSGSGNKTFNNNPTAVATFGIFRGNDRIIYQREVTN